ncbi:MAG: AMP-binding protein, partial [Deltaproteobacteria bacterium]|nr:AMP-binding protein [Deltaproteobacteria bacterium]
MGGLAIILRAVLFGGAVVVADRFDEAIYLRLLREQRVTHLSVVATMLERLYAAVSSDDTFASLRCVLLGGGPAPEELVEASLARGVPVSPTYGLTECASQVATLPPGLLASHWDSVGTAIPGVNIRIAREDGGMADADEEGEICVAGAVVTAGYWNRPGETARALRNGWLHTGDRGRMDAAGAITVLARESDLILSGGENVYPAEVERALLVHPDVADAAVLGMPDDRWGAVPVALVVRRAGTAIDAAALLDHCGGLLARYKTPRSIRFVESLPRTALGKLRRRAAARLLE